jgi:hypothetical protein
MALEFSTPEDIRVKEARGVYWVDISSTEARSRERKKADNLLRQLNARKAIFEYQE